MSLTTLSAVKAYKGLGSSDLDATISALIPRAEAAVLAHLSRVIEQGAVTETRDGTGGMMLLLREWPVVSVATVKVDGQTIPLAAALGQAGWAIAERTLILNGYRFTRGMRNVQIVYTAGYSATPGDIEQAVIETVLLSLERRTHLDVSSKSLAGETISFITAQLSPSARQLLQPHRRVAPL